MNKSEGYEAIKIDIDAIRDNVVKRVNVKGDNLNKPMSSILVAIKQSIQNELDAIYEVTEDYNVSKACNNIEDSIIILYEIIGNLKGGDN